MIVTFKLIEYYETKFNKVKCCRTCKIHHVLFPTVATAYLRIVQNTMALYIYMYEIAHRACIKIITSTRLNRAEEDH